MRHAGIEHAAALLVTMDNAQAAKAPVTLSRRLWPHLPVLVRSRGSPHSDELLVAGATTVVPEALEASMQLSGYVLRAIGYPREDADAYVEVLRRHNCQEVRSVKN